MSPDLVLDVSGLRIRRGTTLLLDDVSWQIRPGEHWVLLGANGSGKTTLLSALTGYVPPTAGEIVVLGRRFRHADWQALRTRIGLVSSSIRQRVPEDEPAFETVLSGKGALLGYWGTPAEADVAEARQVLAEVDAMALADRPWRHLSQGERQRVLVGRALVARPELLILDEPCAGLDPAAREHFLQFLQRLGRAPGAPTLVLVTHHVEEVMPVFTHALLLRAGRVLAAGPVPGVLSARLLGATFGSPVTLRRRGGRYAMTVRAGGGPVF
jgi:iron complex transport system ATP-binding protein